MSFTNAKLEAEKKIEELKRAVSMFTEAIGVEKELSLKRDALSSAKRELADDKSSIETMKTTRSVVKKDLNEVASQLSEVRRKEQVEINRWRAEKEAEKEEFLKSLDSQVAGKQAEVIRLEKTERELNDKIALLKKSWDKINMNIDSAIG